VHFSVPWGIPQISARQGTYFGHALISEMAWISSFNQHKVHANIFLFFCCHDTQWIRAKNQKTKNKNKMITEMGIPLSISKFV
jgi:hypothetical protein